LLLVLTACSQPEVPAYELLERMGITYHVNSDKPFTGSSVEFHQNGRLLSKKNYRDGKSNGLDEVFHANGQLANSVSYREGEQDGPQASFGESGEMLLRANFKSGKRDGLFETFFWENGQLETRTNYKEGKRDGLAEEFYKNGKLKIRYNYRYGKRDGLAEEFCKNGKLHTRRNYKDDTENGPAEWFDENGKLARTSPYDQLVERDGVSYQVNSDEPFTGIALDFHGNGQLRLRYNYKNGKMDGLVEEFRDGKLYWHSDYIDGETVPFKIDENGNFPGPRRCGLGGSVLVLERI